MKNPFENFNNRKGESKIERGLKEFRIYRVAQNDKLLHLQPDFPIVDFERFPFGHDFNRALFFTTQKNMALEYRIGEGMVLLEERGVDFLSDLQKLEDQGVKIVLFSHRDLIGYQKILRKDVNVSKEELENFLRKHIFLPSQISPRMLRKTAEIIILMPKGLDVLPLNLRRIKKQQVRRLALDKNFLGGLFHQKLIDVNKKPNFELRSLKRRKKRLERRRSELFEKIMRAKNHEEKDDFKLQLKFLNKKIALLQEKIDKMTDDS